MSYGRSRARLAGNRVEYDGGAVLDFKFGGHVPSLNAGANTSSYIVPQIKRAPKTEAIEE